MKRLLLLAALGILFVACTDDPAADQVVGSYSCNVAAYTRYAKHTQYTTPHGERRDTIVYRDTSYTYGKGSVSLSKIDDNNVAMDLKCSSLSLEEHYDRVHLEEYSYQAGLTTSKDTVTIWSKRYKATLSGNATYDPKSISLTLRVEGYPNSYGRYNLSFNSR